VDLPIPAPLDTADTASRLYARRMLGGIRAAFNDLPGTIKRLAEVHSCSELVGVRVAAGQLTASKSHSVGMDAAKKIVDKSQLGKSTAQQGELRALQSTLVSCLRVLMLEEAAKGPGDRYLALREDHRAHPERHDMVQATSLYQSGGVYLNSSEVASLYLFRTMAPHPETLLLPSNAAAVIRRMSRVTSVHLQQEHMQVLGDLPRLVTQAKNVGILNFVFGEAILSILPICKNSAISKLKVLPCETLLEEIQREFPDSDELDLIKKRLQSAVQTAGINFRLQDQVNLAGASSALEGLGEAISHELEKIKEAANIPAELPAPESDEEH
jgi:hypothetical protein